METTTKIQKDHPIDIVWTSDYGMQHIHVRAHIGNLKAYTTVDVQPTHAQWAQLLDEF
jgi:hypothetical protein